MTFDRLYRISFYLMLFLGTLALNVDVSRDNPIAPAYPIVVAIAGLIAMVTVDRNPALGLPRSLANLLGVASIALSVIEFRYDPSLLVLAMGHWLVYLQLIKMFLPKSVEDDWFLFALSLVQVVVGAFQPGERMGFVLLAWALVALWTLRLFHLRRETALSSTSRDSLGDDPYPGLVDLSFLRSALKVAVFSLGLGGLIFLLMPRWDSTRGRNPLQAAGLTRHLTGFSDSVRLGQMGEILESDSVVMSVELFDAEENRLEPPKEALWRGVTLLNYEAGRWTRGRLSLMEFDMPSIPRVTPARPIRQRIALEPSDADVLFGLRPIAFASGPDLAMNVADGTLYRSDMRTNRSFLVPVNRHPGMYTYEVISDWQFDQPQPYEIPPLRTRGIFPGDRRRASMGERIEALLAVPDEVRSQLEPFVGRILQSVPNDPAERARALERFLRDGEYAYTLRMSVIDPSIDPVLDFLFNRKEGHCEYYASALTLMLRTAGIPARMVNGFKGGDYNNLAGTLYIRQKHAHSWTEAFLGVDKAPWKDEKNPGLETPLWLSLDPTPSRQRDEVVAQVGGVARRFRFASDYFRYIWYFYVVGFDANRQDRLIYGPIKALLEDARAGFGVMGTALVRALRWLTHFPNMSSVFSIRGFLLSVVSLLLLAGLVRLALWLDRRLGWRRRREAIAEDELASGAVLYRRLAALLESLGLRRPPAETPREFARRAGEMLSARGPDEHQLGSLPTDVVTSYYSVRYGAHPIPPETLEAIESRLDAMEQTLRPKGPVS